MASRQPDGQTLKTLSHSVKRLLALPRHPDMPSHPPASHPNTALRYCTCHIRSPGGMPWMYIVLCHTLAVTLPPRAAHPHARTHTPGHSHSLPSPFPRPASSTTAQAAQGVERHPTTLAPARGPPVPGKYLRPDPSLSWPAGKRTLASPGRQARPCASWTALSRRTTPRILLARMTIGHNNKVHGVSPLFQYKYLFRRAKCCMKPIPLPLLALRTSTLLEVAPIPHPHTLTGTHRKRVSRPSLVLEA